MVCQIAIKTNNDLCFDQGIQHIKIIALAKDQFLDLIPGTLLNHQTTITGSNGDTDVSNNPSMSTTRIPSIDLTLDVIGSRE